MNESMSDWKIELRDKFLGRLSGDEFLDMFEFIEKTLQQQRETFRASLKWLYDTDNCEDCCTGMSKIINELQEVKK